MTVSLKRRDLLALAALVATPPADACTLVASVRPERFSDSACRRSLAALVAAIHRAPTLSEADRHALASELDLFVDTDVSDPILDYPALHPVERSDVLLGWSQAAGTPDRTPIRLHEVNLLKADRGIALYQFTLERDRFYPATEDDCFGDQDAHFGRERRSYLGTFRNNRLREMKAFDEWLLTR